MLIALNTVMAGIVLVGLVSLLARAIVADRRATANHTLAPTGDLHVYQARSSEPTPTQTASPSQTHSPARTRVRPPARTRVRSRA